MDQPQSLSRDISPPPTRKESSSKIDPRPKQNDSSKQNGGTAAVDGASTEQPSLAAIEAGEAQIRDHLTYFSERLYTHARPTPRSTPRIPMEDFMDLYRRNQRQHGRHFVIHQHDHPISGVHYDLRLQFSDTSTVSFAVPYGLPGNPNSIRPNRTAIETRVHNLWNNLIESASHATGSLLIWDTGEYEILPYGEETVTYDTDHESNDRDQATEDRLFDNEKLFTGFQSRHLRIRLHGRRLPPNYAIGLRLPSANNREGQPMKPKRKRRRTEPAKSKDASVPDETESESESTAGSRAPSMALVESQADADDAADASEAENERKTIRTNNAYTGASNTIGSIHQRHWFLTLDRKHSGFQKARNGTDEGRWIGDWDPFFVMGRGMERSVVTGRLADDVMADEGVEKFVGRKMWRPITE